jgi:outer membrane protease
MVFKERKGEKKMKYIAIIDTDDYENFEFFEDATGKYLAVKDVNAKDDEWMALQFKEAPEPMKISICGELGYKDTTTTKHIKEGYNQALRDCGVLED